MIGCIACLSPISCPPLPFLACFLTPVSLPLEARGLDRSRALLLLLRRERVSSTKNCQATMAKELSALHSCEGNTGHQVKRFIHWLNYILVAAAVASIVVVFEIRMSPTPWGWAFIMVGSVSILSAATACLSSSHETGQFFLHLFLLFSSIAGQGASFLMLFARPDLNMEYLKPKKGDHDTRVLMKVDAVLFLCMFCIQLAVLMLACAVYNCNFLDDYEDLEAKKARKGRRLARVQEESTAKAARKEREAADELNKKMKEKYGQWAQEGEFETKK